MKYLTFAADGGDRCGRLDGAEIVELEGDLLTSLTAGTAPTGRRFPLADAKVLAPLPQARLFCIGLNYPKPHPLGGFVTGPDNISFFIKHHAALVAEGEAVRPPGVSVQFDYECELAVVIGRGGHRISKTDAMAHVAGYTILNDGSVRDWQKHSVAAGKNFYQSGSWGPVVVSADEVADWKSLQLMTRLNGHTVQDTLCGNMFFGLPEIIAYLSTITPLVPGDVIATGSPEGTGATQTPPRFLKTGDRLEFEIQPVGILTNTVA